MKIDGRIPSGLAEAGPAARALEAAGYDCGATAETKHDPFLPLAAAALTTTSLELLTSITVAFARNPMTLAQVAHDLNAGSSGRFILGLGTQIAPHITRRFSMPWSHPAPRMREMISAMHAIWDAWYDGKPLEFRGEFYTHTLMTPYFVPEDLQYGRPRIMLAAVGPGMTKVAAEVADGVLCHSFTTPKYMHEVTIPQIEQTLAAGGRDRKKFDIVAQLFTVVGDTDEEIAKGLQFIRGQISFYGSTPAYKGVLERHGWHDLQPQLHALSRQGKWDEMAKLLTDEVVETFAVIGTAEQVADKLVKLYAGKVDRTGFPFTDLDPDRQKALLAKLKSA
ncbi:MAG: TIGR03617 family F420-dependent LLM class oxidoreductase [Caulobacteraceae bacterium]|nr:TIGR03617 family F420-dependent LLM class oxidoreductase [Caulobacteraceae bacterium]